MSEPKPDQVAFLRAVNVGGNNKVPMAGLRELFADLGYPGAKTYVQSGNIVFAAGPDAKDRKALAARIEDGILDRFGVRSPVILRSAAELAKAIKASPYAAGEADPTRVMIGFLADKPVAALVKAFAPPTADDEECNVIGSEVHLHFGSAGSGRSKLAAAKFDKALGTVITTRNIRSCHAVLALLRPPT